MCSRDGFASPCVMRVTVVRPIRKPSPLATLSTAGPEDGFPGWAISRVRFAAKICVARIDLGGSKSLDVAHVLFEVIPQATSRAANLRRGLR